ncbi:MAG TPA: 4Fe-4S dicluster domain-containing protein [Steroidobacteraceae bacterium]|nr:4Fe-4S dicluster domain-containing protein [Steroidobacteraceae bacterium]
MSSLRQGLWRSLEERTGADGVRPTAQPAAPLAGMDRRQFFEALGASLTLAGLAGCSRPPQGEIVPYVHAPLGQTDGLPRFFASTLTRDGYAHGVLVESTMGRPTKIEGNPHHPASLGATDIYAQASVLQLWDPDRSQSVLHRGEPSTWDAFAAALESLAVRFARSAGQGLHILSGTVTSPTLAAQLDRVKLRYPRARWHVHQPSGNDNALAGAELAFGQRLSTQLQLRRAEVIVGLDADFLGDPAAGVRYARDFVEARSATGSAGMSRLYVIEPTPSITGAMADHRLPMESRRIAQFACALGRRLGVPAPGCAELTPDEARWLEALASDLQAHHGAALVVTGAGQPAWMHALGHALNLALASHGATLACTEPVEKLAEVDGTLASLASAMHAGEVDTLLVLDANPAYDAPADLDFARGLGRVAHLLHLGLYRDETGVLAEWHLPQAHQLESWSDGRAFDGTASLAQPLIAPLYGGRSAHELLAMLTRDEVTEGRALVRRQWQRELPDERAWQAALQSGVIAGSAFAPRSLPLRQLAPAPLPNAADQKGLELLFRSDPTVGDGRWSNNSWLQELPKPLTQLTWDNPLLVSPALAARQSLANGDRVELRLQGRSLRAAVWIMPGQAEGSVTLHLGYGRRLAGRVGSGTGFNAYLLRSSQAPWSSAGLELVSTGGSYPLASTQRHFAMEGREPVRVGTLGDYRRDPAFATAGDEFPGAPPSLYPEYPPGEYAWGMSIDLNACIGCKACTIACQAENNIPTVGKEQVQRGREMHWIRVDRYYEGAPENPRSYSQPVPCMMCEHAPCELVCPVGATVHDAEGLNVQVYNRCVGTRFCSNNCPYKVRRFNFLQYLDRSADTLKAQRNPDVSVRRRGVMEKCTYCIQRIEEAHILADRENRRIGAGEVLTACQAVCPTQAIRFGDCADPASAVAQAKRSPRNYLLLAELNSRPRTSYLARLRNPNPLLEEG